MNPVGHVNASLDFRKSNSAEKLMDQLELPDHHLAFKPKHTKELERPYRQFYSAWEKANNRLNTIINHEDFTSIKQLEEQRKNASTSAKILKKLNINTNIPTKKDIEEKKQLFIKNHGHELDKFKEAHKELHTKTAEFKAAFKTQGYPLNDRQMASWLTKIGKVPEKIHGVTTSKFLDRAVIQEFHDQSGEKNSIDKRWAKLCSELQCKPD